MTAQEISIKNTSALKSFRIQNGFSLLELLVAIGLGSIAAGFFSTGAVIIMNSSFFAQESVTRSELTRTLRNAIVDHRSLQETKNHNPKLNAVITNDYTAVGSIFTNSVIEISIYSGAGQLLSGTSLAPALYMIDGSRCPAGYLYGQGNCVIKATSSFMVQGKPDVNNLHRMSSIGSLPINLPTSPTYPTVSPASKAELIYINFQIDFFHKPGTTIRKPSKVSVFINMDDLGF